MEWLWYPYIPFGKVTLLQGDPGDGKSQLMLAVSALVSRGKPLPFADEEDTHEPMTVIYQTTEDDADDTVVPRFIVNRKPPIVSGVQKSFSGTQKILLLI